MSAAWARYGGRRLSVAMFESAAVCLVRLTAVARVFS
jgi:hypothetical protein